MITYSTNTDVDTQELDRLFHAAWPRYSSKDLDALLDATLYHVVASEGDSMVGFIRVLQCGTVRGFVLGPTVHPDAQGKGVGIGLLEAAAEEGRKRGLKQLHVEFASNLRGFYGRAGFRHTAAGIKKL